MQPPADGDWFGQAEIELHSGVISREVGVREYPADERSIVSELGLSTPSNSLFCRLAFRPSLGLCSAVDAVIGIALLK